MSLNTLIPVLWLLGVLYCAGAFYVNRHLKATVAANVVVLLALMGIWALGTAGEMTVDSYVAKRVLVGVIYVGTAFTAPTWARFILEYTTHRRQLRHPVVLALYGLAILFTLSNWYNPFGLFYRSLELAEVGGASYLLPTYGPLFWGPAVLMYGTLLAVVAGMWMRCLRGQESARHTLLITAGVAAPLLVNLFYLLRIVPCDMTPVGFIVSVAVLVLLHKSAFFAQLPISRRKLFESVGDGVLLLNGRQEVVDLNSAALRMLGLEPGPLAMRTVGDYVAAWRESSGQGVSTRFVQTFQHPTRGQRYYRVSVNTLESRTGERRGSMLLIQDETALYHAEERIRYLENYDSATGFMGRQFFTRLLSQEIELCASVPQTNAVMCVSIVNFNDYCHMYGSEFGDALRREVGLRMQHMLRKYDAISRFPEDEFYLFFRFEGNGISPQQNILRVIERLMNLFSTPITVGESAMAVRLRCGVAFCPQHASSADKLIAMAKVAQLHAGKAGGRLYQCYDETMGMSMNRYLKLEQCLHTALSRGELSVVFHPQVDLRTGRVVGVETLLRWMSPELGPVSPAEFIQVAEETGDIKEIGMWVITQAVAQAASWQRLGLADLRVAVNVSLGQLTDPGFADRVIALVTEYGVDPAMLELEITESMALSQEALTCGHLPRLRQHGFRMAMDDFGMGHSSLSYIKQFDVDTLKIDRVLSQDMLCSQTSVAMIRSVEALCRDLRMDTVVEYVEEQAQLDLLAEIGCYVVQGYFFTPPLSPEACTRFILDRHEGTVVA